MRFTMALLFCLAALPAAANEAQIRKALEQKFQGLKIEGVAQGPVAGLWEVHYRTERGVEILYATSNASHIILEGRILDVRLDRDLTQERLRKLNAIRFNALPLERAVKIQRGNGKHVLAMFSDPYCPACKQFEQTLQHIDDITVYVFMYPVIRPELADHSKAVWCSPDRSKAWLDLALRGQRPTASPTCDTPVEKIVELGQSLRITSTPTLIFANGERVAGGLRIADLQQQLDNSAAAR